MDTILPDYLRPGLKLVFCGTAAGTRSAERGHYYAGPGNRFWPTLYDTGLISEPLTYHDDARIHHWGIGLTDLVKHHYGQDSDLHKDMYDADALRSKIERFAPAYLAFTSKNAAKSFFGLSKVEYGLQDATIGTTRLYVLPSTSGLATSFWQPAYWHKLAAEIRVLQD